ncbi:FHA domain-containing protein [Pseudonocardia sp. GCM10023141]|uniref:FHA domain-containing protein n=1 Tax=Pseudonocardia sp. GCM10023141 TaxID=3252653 RepID=UPI00360B7D69
MGSAREGEGGVAPGTLVARTVGTDLTFGPNDGRTVLFGRQAADVHICVGSDDLGVSRRHGALTCDGDRWSVRNLGRRPLRLPSGELHTNADPAPLADGHTPIVVPGSSDRQHLLEIYVVGADGVRPRPRHDHETHHPVLWPLTEAERLVLLVLGQRYLRNQPNPQPLSRRDAAAELTALDPGAGWTYKKVEHHVKDVRERMARRGVSGLRAEEVPSPIGNQLNENLIRELIRTSTLQPGDLTRLDG